MALRQVATIDLASLEQFQSELIEAGFEPLPGALTEWEGPIAECLRPFTDAVTMKVKFLDGWPFQYPRLFVDGIDELHMNAEGELCLWHWGATSDQWLTFRGYIARIEEWARKASQDDFGPEDFALDAHLAFGNTLFGTMATVDLTGLRLSSAPGGTRVISGRWADHKKVLEIVAGEVGPIEGRGYWVAGVRTAPRDIEAARSLLSTSQRKNFDRRFRGVAQRDEPRLFLIAWRRQYGNEALVILAEKRDDAVVAQAIEVAPTDMDYLRLRAGRDADVLSAKCVVIFGAGAVGSNVAFRLAEAGVGKLVLVDRDRLRPGDIVRHAADRCFVGCSKVSAIFAELKRRTPWTEVSPIVECPWSPERINEIIDGCDCVIDATGYASFTNQMSVLTARTGAPLVSAALFRGGSVARVRRQAASTDVPITSRAADSSYPAILDAPEDLAFEPGCSAPVNNASPPAVAAAAARAASVAIDFLTGQNAYGDEVIDVFCPLEAAPFDRVGTVRA